MDGAPCLGSVEAANGCHRMDTGSPSHVWGVNQQGRVSLFVGHMAFKKNLKIDPKLGRAQHGQLGIKQREPTTHAGIIVVVVVSRQSP